MRKEVRERLKQNQGKKRERGRPVGYLSSRNTDPAAWEAKLAKLGLTVERGERRCLLYENEINLGITENGRRVLLHEVFDGEVFVRFYLEQMCEQHTLRLSRVLEDEKLLSAHNKRLISQKREGLKSLLERGKLTQGEYDEASRVIVPAALAWQALGYEADLEPREGGGLAEE